jgi:cation diffusion facilitator family transporter
MAEHEHEHEHEPHDHHAHSHEHGSHPHDHGSHGHSHPTGIRGFFYGLFVPHSHDAADSIDDALEASSAGVRALKISLFALLGTTILQLVIFLISGSVALLADTIHNFADALTAVPLWIAFVLARRAATKHYNFGFGRAEDLAGLFIVAVVALSAIVAGYEAINRFFHPTTLHNLGWVIVAGAIGFAGNELVAIYRTRVGRQIGSAALVADGVHARLDGFTSLSVVLGAIGVMIGLPLADPIIGLLISISILILLWGTVRSIGRRLMDGIDPDIVERAEHALEHTPGVVAVSWTKLRWVGHRLQGSAGIHVGQVSLADAEHIVHEAQHELAHALPNLDAFDIVTATGAQAQTQPHSH